MLKETLNLNIGFKITQTVKIVQSYCVLVLFLQKVLDAVCLN